ncbi:MAG: response regulator [Thermoguttaceae bacterium]|nr:response regulator [Thermoguttaceae bacterium]
MGQTIGRPMELLVVEDNLLQAGVLLELLRCSRFRNRVTLARDAAEALAFLRREGLFAQAPRPDLVLLELNLPGKGGWELLAEIRADRHLADLRVVVVSAADLPEDVLHGKGLRVDGYLVKPVDPEQFLSVVDRLRSCWLADALRPAAERLHACGRAGIATNTEYPVLST